MRHHPAAEIFPLLADDELRDLADDIKANGLLEPIWLHDGAILDGRNRWAACQMVGVEPRTRNYTGDDPVGFAVSLNLKRRHLTTGQKAFVALEVLPLYREQARKSQGERNDLTRTDFQAELPESQPVSSRERESRERAAKAVGVSGRAVAQAKRLTENAPDLAVEVKAGSFPLDRAERIVRDREAEARRIEQGKRDAALAGVVTTVDIRHGDFRDVLAELTGVDAIITDPPYPAEFLPLLDDLAAWADKVLAPDGVLAVLIGKTYLPDVFRRLDGHRPYRWTGCYLTPGPGYVSHARRVQSNWKPVLVYGGGKRFADVVRSEGSDADAKNHHKWGQDYGAFHTLVERLTDRGQTVVDPFMGSGTTLLAARSLGRHAIGCDLEAEHVETARRRIA